MPKARVPEKTPPTFKQFLENIEPTVLQGAILQLEGSIGWGLIKAYLKQRQREFEIAALDLAGHTGKSHEAAKASGYSQACEDVANVFMQELMDCVQGKNGYVEGPTREEI